MYNETELGLECTLFPDCVSIAAKELIVAPRNIFDQQIGKYGISTESKFSLKFETATQSVVNISTPVQVLTSAVSQTFLTAK